MRERLKKVTVEQLRTLYPFDAVTLAAQAGVDLTTVYFAIQLIPIQKRDAQKLLLALSQHTRLHLTLEQVDLMIWERCLLLWVVRASTHQPVPPGELREAYHLLYARDQQHAAFLSQKWLAQYPHLPLHAFTAWPAGFHVGNDVLPGRLHIEADE